MLIHSCMSTRFFVGRVFMHTDVCGVVSKKWRQIQGAIESLTFILLEGAELQKKKKRKEENHACQAGDDVLKRRERANEEASLTI